MGRVVTVDDVLARIEAIKAAAGDWEATHALSDDLYRDVLYAIRLDPDNAAELASAVLGVEDLDYTRWYS